MRKFAIASLAAGLVLISSPSEAQRAAQSALSSASALRVPLRQGMSKKPTITWLAGIATGDGGYDLGIMLGASVMWDLASAPFDLRFDPSVARHGGEVPGYDLSILFFNLPVAAEYVFKNAASSVEPYVMGGLGLHYAKVSADVNIPGLGAFSGSDSDTNLGITVGGGVRMKNRFSFEARMVSIDGFTTIPLLVGYRM